MRQAILLTVVTVLSILFVAADKTEVRKEKEDNNIIEKVVIIERVKLIEVEPVSMVTNKMIEEVDEEEHDMPQRPKFKNPIPLPEKVLDELYKICIENELSFTLVLAIAQVESNFDPSAKSKTGDNGLMQINRKSQSWLAEMAGLEEVDPLDPYHSILMATEYLIYLRNYFSEFDLSEEDKFNYVVGGYNYGQYGIQKYAKKYDVSQHPYVLKVLTAKSELEQNIIEEVIIE